MKKITTINEIREIVSNWKKDGYSIGLVPTMGYLHEGHGSLIKRASDENDRVIVTNFVNPTQFGANEDLDKYPRDLKRDSILCEKMGADIMFCPSVEEMYPTSPITFVNVNEITEGLCGAKRPGHFQGVCSVVTKLFNITSPNKAYFGEKDYQQLAVLKTMTKELNFPIDIVGCPIIREDDGLAKSSRNTYLNDEERKAAIVLFNSLKLAEDLINKGITDSKEVYNKIIEFISDEPLAKIDYVEIVNADTLKQVEKLKGNILIALAVYIGKTRLIDNKSFNI
jgi:pantoate--beta-alanine ligase